MRDGEDIIEFESPKRAFTMYIMIRYFPGVADLFF
jgi:hypothetical protein